MIIKLNVKYSIGQVVYAKTDPEQLKHIVTSFYVTATDVLYECSFMDKQLIYHAYELTKEKDYEMVMGIEKNEE